jgi:serine/threonine protein kinase
MKADQLNLPHPIIQMLLDCDLPYTDTGSPVTYHAHSWAWIIQQTGKKYFSVIENIITLHESIVPLLTKACDVKGIPLLTSADPTIRQLLMKRAFYCGRYELLTDSFGGGCYGVPPIHFSKNSIVITAIDYDAELSYYHAFQTHCTKVASSPSHPHQALNQVSSPPPSSSITAQQQQQQGQGQGQQQEVEIIDSVGQLLSALHRLGSYLEPHRINFTEIFSNCDVDINSGGGGGGGAVGNENQQRMSVTREEFLKYCRELFGYRRKVVIKLMKHEKLFQKEITYRQSCNLDSRYVIPLIDEELHELQRENQHLIRDTLSRSSCTSSSYSSSSCSWLSLPFHAYPHLLVMPVGWNTLQHVFHHMTLNPTQLSSIIRDIAQALQHIHSRGICHSHLKLSSIIRIGERYCLTDLTAATNLEIFYIQDAEVIGSLFSISTGYLPPEMFIPVTYHNEQQIRSYWKTSEMDSSSSASSSSSERYHEMKTKVLPHRSLSGDSSYCVRAYDVDLKTLTPRDLHLLPYRPVLASAQIDMWSLGLILYALCSRETLLPLDSADDLIYSEDYCQSALWSSESLLEKLDEMIADPLAADLCALLLQPNSKDRPHSMKQILDHVYFSSLSNKRNSYIEQKIETIYAESAKRKHRGGPRASGKKRRSGQRERERPQQDGGGGGGGRERERERDRARDPGRSSGTSSSTVYSQTQLTPATATAAATATGTQKRKSNPLREFTSRFSPIPTRTNTPDSSVPHAATPSASASASLLYEDSLQRPSRGRVGSDANSSLGLSIPRLVEPSPYGERGTGAGAGEGILSHIQQIHRILRGELFHGMELNIPTCFIITNQLLDPNHISAKTALRYQHSEEEKGDDDDEEEEEGEGEGQRERSYDRDSPAPGRGTGTGRGISMTPECESGFSLKSFVMPRVTAATRWFSFYSLIHNALSSSDRGVEMIATALQGMCEESELFFYLIDELTMLPVISPLLSTVSSSPSPASPSSAAPQYPLRIRNPAEVIPRLLPLMKNSYMAIASRNNLHLFGTAFGFPPSHSPPDLRTLLAAESVADLDSSLDLPKLLQNAGFLKRQPTVGSPRTPLSANVASTAAAAGGGTDSPSQALRKSPASASASWSRRLSYKMFGEEGVEDLRGFEGHPLQELAKFYCEHDAQSSYCQLKKISLHDGSQVWTTKESLCSYGLRSSLSGAHNGQEADLLSATGGAGGGMPLELRPSPRDSQVCPLPPLPPFSLSLSLG